MTDRVYYETGRSNSGDIEEFSTLKRAKREAQKIANKFNETVFIEKRTDDDIITYYEVKPTKRGTS